MVKKPVIVIAMSGGVDSSVAAAMLVEQGYSVIGMMLRLWSEEDSSRSNRCCAPDAVAMARRIAGMLSIPFYVVDTRQIFFDSVVQPFIDGYTHNTTPNPCVFCNRLVRWGFLLNHALDAGADFLATGHYARRIQNPDGSLQLLRGVDPAKDQSYVLHSLNQHQLKHTLFPLGEYSKPVVRQLAQKYSLPVADRPDSQDLCFIGADGDYRQFLKRHAPEALTQGAIEDEAGEILGHHNGLALYTIGQRKGLGISATAPFYVLHKDTARNALIVGNHDQAQASELIARDFNWISGSPPEIPIEAMVKIRYKAPELPAHITPLNDLSVHARFENPVRDITPGQAAVLYNGEVCLGGGIISDQMG